MCPITIPSDVLITKNKDIFMRDQYMMGGERAIAIAYNESTGIYTVQSYDGKRTNKNMQMHLDFKLFVPRI